MPFDGGRGPITPPSARSTAPSRAEGGPLSRAAAAQPAPSRPFLPTHNAIGVHAPLFSGHSSSPVYQRENQNIQKSSQLEHRYGDRQVDKPPQHHGGGFSLGAIAAALAAPIAAPAAAAFAATNHFLGGTPAHLALAAGKGALDFGANQLKGGEQLASAAYDDLTHGRLGSFNYSPDMSIATGHGASETARLAADAANNDALVQLATGHPGRAWGLAKNDPVGAAMDVAGLYSGVGGLAGKVARSGFAGDRAAAWASTARDPLNLGEGVTPAARSYAKNPFTKMVQQARESDKAVSARRLTAALNRRADMLHSANTARTQTALGNAAEQLAAEQKAAGHVAGAVPHAVIGLAGQDATRLHERLQELHDAQVAAENGLAVHKSLGLKGKENLRANAAHQKGIQTYLDNPDPALLADATAKVVERQHALDAEKAHLGLLEPDPAERRALMPWASDNIPGVKHFSPADAQRQGVFHPAHFAYRDAAKMAKQTKADLTRAQNRELLLARQPGGAESRLRDAERGLAKAVKAETGSRGFIRGRLGPTGLDGLEGSLRGNWRARSLDASPHPKLSRTMGDHLGLHMGTTDAALQEFRAARQNLLEDRAARTQQAKDTIAAKRDAAKDAAEHASALEWANRKPLTGWLQPDATHPGGWRPLPTAEIKDAMRQHGADPVAYLRMTAPQQKLREAFGSRFSRGGGKSKAYTGRGLLAGAWEAGYKGIAKSQLGDVYKINQAKALDDLIREGALKDSTGATHDFSEHDYHDFKQRWEEEHGVPLTAVYRHPPRLSEEQVARINAHQDAGRQATKTVEEALNARNVEDRLKTSQESGGRVALVPSPLLDRYKEHLALDSSSGAFGRAWRAQARQFRNTVLPFSTKLFVMHGAEGGLRAAIAGGLRPGNRGLAESVLQKMEAEGPAGQAAAEKLRNLGLQGGHYSLAQRLNQEQLGYSAPRSATGEAFHTSPAGRALDAYNQHVVQNIFGLHGGIERFWQKGVLGAHMRDKMTEFAGSWRAAQAAQQQAMEHVASGMAHNPAEVEAAVRKIHDTMGKYSAFTPSQRRIISYLAPFAAWYGNAAKFVYKTMPKDHPLLTATLLSISRARAQDWNAGHSDAITSPFFGNPEGALTSDLKVGPSAYEDVGRFLPQGAFSEGPVGYLSSAALPQAQDIWNALHGRDAFGKNLTGPNGEVKDEGSWVGNAVSSILADYGGPASVGERTFLDRGRTPYSASTLWNRDYKPDSNHTGATGVLAGVKRVLFPFEPVHVGSGGTEKPRKVKPSFGLGGKGNFSTGGKGSFSSGGKGAFG